MQTLTESLFIRKQEYWKQKRLSKYTIRETFSRLGAMQPSLPYKPPQTRRWRSVLSAGSQMKTISSLNAVTEDKLDRYLWSLAKHQIA